jgi:hypothetical protein
MIVIGYNKLETPAELAGAILPRESGVFFKSFDPNLKGFVSSYLALLGNGYLSSAPVAVARDDGSRAVRTEPTEWKHPQALSRVAERLTFHPENREKLVFRQMELEDKWMEGAQLLGSREIRCDLLNVSKDRSPICSCYCGGKYRVEKKSCPSCLGDNPLGIAVRDHGRKISSEIRKRLQKELVKRTDSTLGELNAAVSRLEAFSNKTQKDPHLPSDGDEKETARALLRYWENIFNFQDIKKDQIKSLSRLREKKYAAVVLAASRVAGGLRTAWSPSSLGGWMPDEDFQKTAIEQLGAIWKQPISDVRDAYFKVFKAAAFYRNIEKSYRRVADRSFLGDLWHSVGKPILTVATAIKTLGISLVLKAGLMLMKSEKERQLYEAFAAVITEATLSAQKAVHSLAKARRAEAHFYDKISKGFEIHMRNLILEDYAKASPDKQKNLVLGLFAKLGLPSSWISSLRERKNIPASPWAKLKNALNPNSLSGATIILLLTTILIGIAIFYAVNFLKQ